MRSTIYATLLYAGLIFLALTMLDYWRTASTSRTLQAASDLMKEQRALIDEQRDVIAELRLQLAVCEARTVAPLDTNWVNPFFGWPDTTRTIKF